MIVRELATTTDVRRPWWRVPAVRTTLVLVLALLGGAALAYPSAAQWISEVARSAAVVHYGETTNALTPKQREGLLRDATAYNDALTDSPLSDPFVATEGPRMDSDAARQSYLAELSTTGGRGEPMARLRFPAINIDLPILHGTDEDALAHGAGHLYGSSLPVGGSNTHSVITAHNGYTGAQMFDGLDQAQVGDLFSITVAGQILEYRVDNIAVVAPDQLDQLRQVTGRDYVTLVTCTPRFINSDRLLVRGERVGTSVEVPHQGDMVPAPSVGPPWWVLLVLLPVALASGVLRITRRRSSDAVDESGTEGLHRRAERS